MTLKQFARRILALTGLFSVLLAPSIAFAKCGAVPTCNDTISSFGGVIVIDGIQVDWNTTHENSDIGYFVLKRYDCADPSACSVQVAVIPATGSCNHNEDYSYVDDPPAPLSDWSYTLETWHSDNTRACATDMQPQ